MPVGIDTSAQPSAQQVAKLIDQLKKEEVAGLFVENITSPALLQQIARETSLKVGGQLFSDALSARGKPATSYLAMFERNLGVILTSLKGQSCYFSEIKGSGEWQNAQSPLFICG